MKLVDIKTKSSSPKRYKKRHPSKHSRHSYSIDIKSFFKVKKQSCNSYRTEKRNWSECDNGEIQYGANILKKSKSSSIAELQDKLKSNEHKRVLKTLNLSKEVEQGKNYIEAKTNNNPEFRLNTKKYPNENTLPIHINSNNEENAAIKKCSHFTAEDNIPFDKIVTNANNCSISLYSEQPEHSNDNADKINPKNRSLSITNITKNLQDVYETYFLIDSLDYRYKDLDPTLEINRTGEHTNSIDTEIYNERKQKPISDQISNKNSDFVSNQINNTGTGYKSRFITSTIGRENSKTLNNLDDIGNISSKHKINSIVEDSNFSFKPLAKTKNGNQQEGNFFSKSNNSYNMVTQKYLKKDLDPSHLSRIQMEVPYFENKCFNYEHSNQKLINNNYLNNVNKDDYSISNENNSSCQKLLNTTDKCSNFENAKISTKDHEINFPQSQNSKELMESESGVSCKINARSSSTEKCSKLISGLEMKSHEDLTQDSVINIIDEFKQAYGLSHQDTSEMSVSDSENFDILGIDAETTTDKTQKTKPAINSLNNSTDLDEHTSDENLSWKRLLHFIENLQNRNENYTECVNNAGSNKPVETQDTSCDNLLSSEPVYRLSNQKESTTDMENSVEQVLRSKASLEFNLKPNSNNLFQSEKIENHNGPYKSLVALNHTPIDSSSIENHEDTHILEDLETSQENYKISYKSSFKDIKQTKINNKINNSREGECFNKTINVINSDSKNEGVCCERSEIPSTICSKVSMYDAPTLHESIEGNSKNVDISFKTNNCHNKPGGLKNDLDLSKCPRSQLNNKETNFNNTHTYKKHLNTSNYLQTSNKDNYSLYNKDSSNYEKWLNFIESLKMTGSEVSVCVNSSQSANTENNASSSKINVQNEVSSEKKMGFKVCSGLDTKSHENITQDSITNIINDFKQTYRLSHLNTSGTSVSDSENFHFLGIDAGTTTDNTQKTGSSVNSQNSIELDEDSSDQTLRWKSLLNFVENLQNRNENYTECKQDQNSIKVCSNESVKTKDTSCDNLLSPEPVDSQSNKKEGTTHMKNIDELRSEASLGSSLNPNSNNFLASKEMENRIGFYNNMVALKHIHSDSSGIESYKDMNHKDEINNTGDDDCLMKNINLINASSRNTVVKSKSHAITSTRCSKASNHNNAENIEGSLENFNIPFKTNDFYNTITPDGLRKDWSASKLSRTQMIGLVLDREQVSHNNNKFVNVNNYLQTNCENDYSVYSNSEKWLNFIDSLKMRDNESACIENFKVPTTVGQSSITQIHKSNHPVSSGNEISQKINGPNCTSLHNLEECQTCVSCGLDLIQGSTSNINNDLKQQYRVSHQETSGMPTSDFEPIRMSVNTTKDDTPKIQPAINNLVLKTIYQNNSIEFGTCNSNKDLICNRLSHFAENLQSRTENYPEYNLRGTSDNVVDCGHMETQNIPYNNVADTQPLGSLFSKKENTGNIKNLLAQHERSQASHESVLESTYNNLTDSKNIKTKNTLYLSNLVPVYSRSNIEKHDNKDILGDLTSQICLEKEFGLSSLQLSNNSTLENTAQEINNKINLDKLLPNTIECNGKECGSKNTAILCKSDGIIKNTLWQVSEHNMPSIRENMNRNPSRTFDRNNSQGTELGFNEINFEINIPNISKRRTSDILCVLNEKLLFDDEISSLHIRNNVEKQTGPESQDLLVESEPGDSSIQNVYQIDRNSRDDPTTALGKDNTQCSSDTSGSNHSSILEISIDSNNLPNLINDETLNSILREEYVKHKKRKMLSNIAQVIDKRIKVRELEELNPSKYLRRRNSYLKIYRKGTLKIYRLRKIQKPRKIDSVDKPVKEMNAEDVLKEVTQHYIDPQSQLESSFSSVTTSSSYSTDSFKSDDDALSDSEELTSLQKNIRIGVNNVLKDKSLICDTRYRFIPDCSQNEVISRIQKLFLQVYKDLMNGRKSYLKYKTQKFDNCIFKDGRLQLKPTGEAAITVVNSASKNSQAKFKLILYVMDKVKMLLETNKKLTKRELYYQLKEMIKDQVAMDRVINTVSCILDVGMWALNIIAQKGLVFGDLKILMSNGEILNCSVPGTLIPQNMTEIIELQSRACFVLVVEKESIFQKFTEENLTKKLTRPFIVITGKGFPDLNTQLFLRKLWAVMSLPVFILVDGDPHGIQIMLMYKFGSVRNAHVSQHLAVPNAKWLGIHPSEIKEYDMPTQPLSARELKMVEQMLKTPYMEGNPQIVSELKILLRNKYKVGIEDILKSQKFLSEVYLPTKLFLYKCI